MRKAHQLAQQFDLRLVPVHHMEAHALVARTATDVQFPFLCMLVSGGHNMLLIAHQVGNYTLLGSTLDDSVGLFYVHLQHSLILSVPVSSPCMNTLPSCRQSTKVLQSRVVAYIKVSIVRWLLFATC